MSVDKWVKHRIRKDIAHQAALEEQENRRVGSFSFLTQCLTYFHERYVDVVDLSPADMMLFDRWIAEYEKKFEGQFDPYQEHHPLAIATVDAFVRDYLREEVKSSGNAAEAVEKLLSQFPIELISEVLSNFAESRETMASHLPFQWRTNLMGYTELLQLKPDSGHYRGLVLRYLREMQNYYQFSFSDLYAACVARQKH